MTMDLLRERARVKLAERIDTCLSIMMNQQFRPAAVTRDGEVMPANTLDEIAVKTLECNAMARAYKWAISMLDEEFKRIVDPGSVDDGERQDDQTDTEANY